MPKVNFDWVKAQLKAASVRQGPGDAALRLLKAWEEITLTGEMARDAVDIFSSLAVNNSLIKTLDDEIWVQAESGGMLQTGDTVRVKHTAYSGEAGIINNGRIGRVTAIRSGDVLFRSTDDLEPFLDNTHHSFTALEKKIR